MAHFYGTLQGSRGQATRCGSKASGIQTVAASWDGAIQVDLDVNDKGENVYRVVQRTWNGAGIDKLIAEGVIGK